MVEKKFIEIKNISHILRTNVSIIKKEINNLVVNILLNIDINYIDNDLEEGFYHGKITIPVHDISIDDEVILDKTITNVIDNQGVNTEFYYSVNRKEIESINKDILIRNNEKDNITTKIDEEEINFIEEIEEIEEVKKNEIINEIDNKLEEALKDRDPSFLEQSKIYHRFPDTYKFYKIVYLNKNINLRDISTKYNQDINSLYNKSMVLFPLDDKQ